MFGLGKAKPAGTGDEVNLDELITYFGQAICQWESFEHAGVLARARFADHCRDMEVMPVSGELFQACWTKLDAEQQQRLCLQIDAIAHPIIRNRSSALCEEYGGPEWLLELMSGLASRLQLLTTEILAESDVRLEEFARHFCAAWNLEIEDESEAKSHARLHAIDFDRLMKEAEAARGSAEERLEFLRKLQEKEEETRRPRRGKW